MSGPDLRVEVGDRTLAADWVDANPETRRAVEEALPVGGEATRWGDELYVRVPVEASPGETRTELPEGALAYWPDGQALCLFWGPTPASRGDEPRAAAPVGVVAQVRDTSALADLVGGAEMRVEADR